MQIDMFRTRMKARLHAYEILPEKTLMNTEANKWLRCLLIEAMEMLEYVHSDITNEYHSILANVEVVITMVMLFLQPAAISAESLGTAKESFIMELPEEITNATLLEFITNLYTTFNHHKAYGIEDGAVKLKTTNAHNCRKTAMLS